MIGALIIFLSASLVLPVTAQLATCQNYGTPLNSTDCKCPGFVTGRLCETVKCQRFSVPDKNRCVCPPGWYDKYCGIRGCRPPNEDNLDLQKRSFIVVVNMKTSMKDQIDSLRNNFPQMISTVTKNHTDNWIANYIIYGFVQVQQDTKLTKLLTEDINEAITFLQNLPLQAGDDKQPVLTALKNAQQTYPLMKSHAIVLVLTDSPASDATSWSHRFTDKNAEQSCLQISLLWRSKVTFLLSLPTGTDTASDGIDVYRRLSLTNHGDTFFLKDSADLQNVLLTVVGAQYYPEVVVANYGKTGDVSIEAPSDLESTASTVFYLITVNSVGASVPSITGLTVASQGQSYKLYTQPASAGKSSVTISSSGSSSVYNYRVFIQSKKTIMFDYNDDMHIDVGNGMAVIGIPMSSTMQTYGLSEWNNSTYEVQSADGSLLREPFNSYTRPQLDCTFHYGFPVWDTLSCPPGPISQVHKFYYNGEYRHQRVTAGYCIESDHNAQHPDGVSLTVLEEAPNKLRMERDAIVCDKKNIDAVSDSRLKGHNQLVFILEQHYGNTNIYSTLSKEIGQIVALASTSSNEFQKEFTLIIHDDLDSRVLLSTYDPSIFVKKFSNLVDSISLERGLDNTQGLLSIVQAQKMNLRPTAQVFYFTNQAVTSVKNVSRTWDIVKRDIEVNFLTIGDASNVLTLPSQLELVRKMTSGRLVPLEGSEQTLVSLFSDIIGINTLTTDQQINDCYSTPVTVNGYVEKDAESVVLQVAGSQIRYVRILDATGNSIPAANYISFQSQNIISYNIDISSYARGVWTITTLATSGSCQVSLRQKSEVGLMLGFTSSQTQDDVSSQIITQRVDSPQPIYVPIRVNSPVVPTSLEIQVVNEDNTRTSYANSTISQRDSNSCSYNFISDKIVIPKTPLTSWIISSYDNSGNLLLHRVFYYYQHLPADTSVCQGNQVDTFGRCICPQGFTGDYCWDRICQPAATYSFGICSCPPGFFGDFCEIELVINSTTTTTYPSTLSVPETTTSVSPHKFNMGLGFSVLLIFAYFM